MTTTRRVIQAFTAGTLEILNNTLIPAGMNLGIYAYAAHRDSNLSFYSDLLMLGLGGIRCSLGYGAYLEQKSVSLSKEQKMADAVVFVIASAGTITPFVVADPLTACVMSIVAFSSYEKLKHTFLNPENASESRTENVLDADYKVMETIKKIYEKGYALFVTPTQQPDLLEDEGEKRPLLLENRS